MRGRAAVGRRREGALASLSRRGLRAKDARVARASCQPGVVLWAKRCQVSHGFRPEHKGHFCVCWATLEDFSRRLTALFHALKGHARHGMGEGLNRVTGAAVRLGCLVRPLVSGLGAQHADWGCFRPSP